jgi:hypothetical protein
MDMNQILLNAPDLWQFAAAQAA